MTICEIKESFENEIECKFHVSCHMWHCLHLHSADSEGLVLFLIVLFQPLSALQRENFFVGRVTFHLLGRYEYFSIVPTIHCRAFAKRQAGELFNRNAATGF